MNPRKGEMFCKILQGPSDGRPVSLAPIVVWPSLADEPDIFRGNITEVSLCRG